MRPPMRKKIAGPRSNTNTQLARMKLRSFKKECVCQMEFRTARNFHLLKLRDSGDFVDKILRSSDQEEISVHRIVMSSLSLTMMKMMETNTTTFLPYPKEVVQALVKLAYTGTCDLKDDSVGMILKAAKEYEIEPLVKICGQYLVSQLTEEVVLSFYRMSVKHCCDHVSGSITKYICINFKRFITRQEAFNLTMEELSVFVKRVELNLKQGELLEFIKEWAKANSFTEFQLKDIMKWIPLKRKPAKVVISTGGWSSDPTNILEVYDDLSSTWSISTIKLPTNSAYHGAVELEDNLYIVGGFAGDQLGYMDRLYCLNLPSMVWKEKSPMMSKRCYIATTTLNGKLIALGGHDGTSRMKTVEMYDPKTNMWTEMPSMLQRRSDFGVTVCDGMIFAIGGFDGQDVLTSVEYFCPAEGRWQYSSSLSIPRSGLRAVAMEGKIFVLGGYDGAERLASVECFTLGTTRSVWYQVPDMLHRRSNFSTSVLEGKLMVTGGYKKDNLVMETGGEVCGDVDLFCPKENKWSEGSRLNIKRSALDCVVMDSGNWD